ncbi:hypothetical protein [Saccharibacillus alkalitolerans]|uniref:Uncharacterized protein n=1 Tax=Saccharibacillus alkalitolerans TaxID=2705290 RepID=A0ABX0F886_9BACL|nr:hypothetical protein [Saccharibacillus alkalitolerans]NGZ76655.1 hypothetical protein [Saccharibacillus alkalitolerans]
MILRKELRPRPVSAAELRKIEGEIEDIERLSERGAEEAASAAIARFNAAYGRSFEPEFFRDYAGSMPRTEFALQASQPDPRRVPDITREELIEIVRRIIEPDRAEHPKGRESGSFGCQPSEMDRPDVFEPLPASGGTGIPEGGRIAALQAFYVELLEANVAMPGVSDLIFWDELEPEEVVDRALAYTPIVLPPG